MCGDEGRLQIRVLDLIFLIRILFSITSHYKTKFTRWELTVVIFAYISSRNWRPNSTISVLNGSFHFLCFPSLNLSLSLPLSCKYFLTDLLVLSFLTLFSFTDTLSDGFLRIWPHRWRLTRTSWVWSLATWIWDIESCNFVHQSYFTNSIIFWIFKPLRDCFGATKKLYKSGETRTQRKCLVIWTVLE